METISFREVTIDMLPRFAEILNYYIRHTAVSFYTEELVADDMREKVFFSHTAFRSFAIEREGSIIGYCSLAPWKKQQAYRHTGEITIYLSPDYTGKGIGTRAICFLVDYAIENGIQVLIAGLCSENEASRRLFEKSGFELCAHFKGVGSKFGRTLDTIYLQRTLGREDGQPTRRIVATKQSPL